MSKMEKNSGEAMSIFGQSIDARRTGRSRRRATQKKFSPAVESQAKPSVEMLHQRRAVAEQERARAESELSRASTMASELEREIEQANATARTHSHRSELQATRAGGSGSSRRKKVPVDVEVPRADQVQDQSNSLYVEVMQELDLVKRELRKLQGEVKAAWEAKAEAERDTGTPTPGVFRSDPRRLDSVKQEASEENEGRGIAELAAEAGGSRKDMQAQDTQTRAKSLQSDTSRSSDREERFATASSSDVGLESAEMAMVPATEVTTDNVDNGESALTITARHGEHEDRSSMQAAAEAELNSARMELESIKEGIRFSNSMERTCRETAQVSEEIDRLVEQEKRASAQVQQLNARLLRARSRLDAATAADEAAESALAELSGALQQLSEETEAAEKERAQTELENRCVREHAEVVGAEIAAAEQRVRASVEELEAARASEAVAAEKLRTALDSAMHTVMEQSSGNVTIPRFEYEYLTGHAEVVRAVAEKKVAAAEAWVEALCAGEKEVVMRLEAIEKEIGEMTARKAVTADVPRGEESEPRLGLQRAQTRRRRAP